MKFYIKFVKTSFFIWILLMYSVSHADTQQLKVMFSEGGGIYSDGGIVMPYEEWSLGKYDGMITVSDILKEGWSLFQGKVNRTVSSSGMSKQWVYRNCTDCDAQYVYTENGIVTSFSD